MYLESKLSQNFKWPFIQKYSKVACILLQRGYSKTLWIEPEGTPTGIHIQNSITNSVVELKTIKPNVLTWYICGPTVYDSAHIGHALCYVRLDVVRRIMEKIFNITVVPAMGITDIDNKLIQSAFDKNKTVKAIAMKYEKEFVQDMSNLNILPPHCYLRVTDHIPQIVSFIKKIFDRGYAYKTDRTVYFDTVAFKRYNKLIRGEIKNEEVTEVQKDKRSSLDFALWKIVDDEHISWPSPWGRGRPGWHIECSAIASQVFGSKLDLHSGGIDLLFPHHESEEAQCCVYHNTDQWCNYWNHIAILYVSGEVKMSKSLKNTTSIPSMLEDISADVFRMFSIMIPYKQNCDFSTEAIQAAQTHLKRINEFIDTCSIYLSGQIRCPDFNENSIIEELIEAKCAVKEKLARDFNTVGAIHIINNLIIKCNSAFSNSNRVGYVSGGLGTVAAVRSFVTNFMLDLGFKMEAVSASNSLNLLDPHLPKMISSFVSFRSQMRNFALLRGDHTNEGISKKEKKMLIKSRNPVVDTCDEFRSSLAEYGVKIKDSSDYSTWSFLSDSDINKKEEN